MQIITTTKNTLAEHLRQISWGKLSKTFQDALTITYELGYQYIWIDSLCIVQDDRSDWETESKNMVCPSVLEGKNSFFFQVFQERLEI